MTSLGVVKLNTTSVQKMRVPVAISQRTHYDSRVNGLRDKPLVATANPLTGAGRYHILCAARLSPWWEPLVNWIATDSQRDKCPSQQQLCSHAP